jgi:RHS repeat-associated protein
MFLTAPGFSCAIFSRPTQTQLVATGPKWRMFACRLLSLLLTYALLLQLVPRVVASARSGSPGSSVAKQAGKKKDAGFSSQFVQAGANGWSEVVSTTSSGSDVSRATITDAVVLSHKPTFNSGRIEGTLRILLGESFAINGSTELTSDLYLPGTPTVQLSSGAQYGGTVSDEGAATPANYTVTFTGGVNLPGRIHNHVDAITLPSDFPLSIPAPTATRTANVHSQSDVPGIEDWQTVRDLNVTGSHLALDVPPGNYGTFTINGNSQLNFNAGTYNFSNTFNLDAGARLRATGLVTINVAKNLTVNSGAVVLGSYTSPADVHLNVLGSLLSVNGSSQVSGLIRAYNGKVILKGTSQVRGQIIADSLTLSGGTVIGAVWPAQSSVGLTVFGPRRFDRTTGSPNQYVEQFALPAGATSPYTLHIQNGEPGGLNRISSATVKLNGIDVLRPNDLNQNVAGLDRTITLAANNQLDVRLESEPGSYLIIDIGAAMPNRDTTPPTTAISSPANNSTTTAPQTTVSGTALDAGAGASGVAHVYVNNSEAAYNSGDGTWTIPDVALALGANQITARAIDQAGNQATTSINVTRESPTNLAPAVDAGSDQALTLPQTASLDGIATDDGLPDGGNLTTTWMTVSGPGIVTFADPAALQTHASFSSAGTYVLGLTATDSALSTTDNLTITVQPQNQPPTVSAGPDQTTALPHTATLNGTVTDDGLPEAGTLAITWSQVSGPGTVTFEDQSLPNTSATFSVSGTYLLRLTASDTELISKSDVTITVQPENQAPTVSAGADQIISLPGVAQLNGVAGDDGWPAGSVLSVSWSFLSGPGSVSFDNSTAMVTIARFAAAGTYLLRLTATDGELSSSDDVSILATPPNQAPTVSAGPDQTITLPNQANLNGSASDDGLPAGCILATEWSQVSGPATVVFANTNVTVTTASFDQIGIYVFRLTANDSQFTVTDDLTITVIDPRAPPVAHFIVPQSSGNAGAFVIASSGSTSGANAADKVLDDSTATFWQTPTLTNQFAKMQFFDQQMVFIDRIRLQSVSGIPSPTSLKDFDVQVSATTSDDAGFVTVLSATVLNNGQLQEFVLPGGPVGGHYIELLPKTNYGGSSSFTLGTFNAVAVGSADNIISLAAQNNSALTQSPGLIANGASIYNFSYAGGDVSPNGLLGYNNGGWFPGVTTNPSAIIQLAGDKIYSLSGIKLATAWNQGSGSATAVRNFEVWVSTTAPDDASFTKVLTATAALSGQLTAFNFPGGPVPARYVKYVPLTNGGGATINTQSFDVLAEGVAQVISASGQDQNVLHPAEAAFDGDVQTTWFSQNNATTNVWVKTALADGASQKVYGVRITPVNDFSNGQRGPKDFDIRISTTTSDDSAFTTVYSGTLAGTFNGGAQEFLFPSFVEARYVQFFWKNGYSTANIGVRTLEVLAAPTRGAALIAFSTQEDPVSNALDLDPRNQWVTALDQSTNQWLKLLLPRADVSTIEHIALRPAIAVNGNYSAPKDFELQVSATDSADSSFTTVLAGTLTNSTQLQDFYFAPVEARYVRLLLKNNYGSGRFGLASFYIYSADQIGSTTRFLDRSTDSDGSVVAWDWNFGDGATSTERNPSHTYAAIGDYTVFLTVTDDSGLTNTRQMLYHVLESLHVDFAGSPQIVHEGGESVRFTDVSQLLVQPTAMRQYDFGDGATLSQATNTSIHTFAESGTYHVTLKIGDPLGISYTATKDIVVLNVAPTVDIPNGKTVVWGEQWTSAPFISDQSVVDRLSLQGQWNFGDGQTSQCVNCTNANATVTHAYGSPGTYTAVLSITDKEGGVSSDSATYVVNKRATSLVFQANFLQDSGQTFVSRLKLTDSFANSGIPNRSIQFNLNGATGTAITDASGIAEITLPIAAGTNVATIGAAWVGDSLYLPSSNAGNTTLNSAPVVSANADQATVLPCGVNLNGSVTDDGVPSALPLTVSWTKVSGPGSVSFANAASAITTATFTDSGKYVLRLTASDSQLSSSDDVTVTVNMIEVGSAQYFGPTPYLSFADSPLGGRSASYFQLENFEDHLLNTPGVTANAGGVSSIVFGSSLHDSVDADDGVIDGNGSAGDAYFSANGAAGITFTFNADVLGSLPTHAGIVWTDGAGQVFFEAFDRNGVSLGLRGPYTFPDEVNNGTTAEDHFLGAYNKDGISGIKISNTVGGIEIDHLQYAFSTVNGSPIVNVGPDQTVDLTVTNLPLNATVFDDGLPACASISLKWTQVSGPGAVSFTNSESATTTATLSGAGIYVLRLTANDSQFTSSDDLVISVNQAAINHPPVVDAGPDQTIILPVNSVNLIAVIADDGQPAGSALTVEWGLLSGPGSVTFGDSHLAATSAVFSIAGTYVLRVVAGDSQLTTSDDLVVIVNPEIPNQPPTVNAGPDNTATISGNLIANPGNDLALTSGEIPYWSEVQGTAWTQGTMESGPGFPPAQRGNAYFFAGNAQQAELRQDIDVSAFAGTIAAGIQQFEFRAYMRSLPEAAPDAGRVILEYRDATNSSVIATLDSGVIAATTDWHLTEDKRAVPPGTGWIRVRLLATRNNDANNNASNDAFFDSVSLQPIGNAAVTLEGSVNDDGLPSGSSLLTTWEAVSGPGPATFANPSAVVSGVSFNVPGIYRLRLTTNDGALRASDDVTVIVNPANQPPSVNAGGNQTITLPDAAVLNGTASDDGQPERSSLSVLWSSISGPGIVTFADPTWVSTSANFSAPGVYLLRLSADDTEYATSSDVTITVNPAAVNQPPTVNTGVDQTITLPIDTVTLNGAAADDGLPAGSTLTISWTQVTGPGTVTFGNANSAVTTAHFSTVGSYVLRLSASDGAYLASADVGVILTPQNQAPTTNAGADQTILLSQEAQLNGAISDDGLPFDSNLTTTWSTVSGPGTVTFGNSQVTVTGAQFSATGSYVLRLTASDGVLSASDDVTITVNDDVPPPTVAIIAPADGTSVTEPTIVTGSVSGGAWTLEYSLDSDDNTNNRVWTTFGGGNGATNGSLGTLDPTMMLNGVFDIRLSATDTYGQVSRTTIAVIVERNLKVGNFTVSFADLNILVAGVPMEVIRTYDTRDKRPGDFGFGWTLGLRNIRVEKSNVLGLKWYETVSQEVFPNYCVEPTGSHVVGVTFPGGKVFKFQAEVAPHCQRNASITTANLSFTPMTGTIGKLEVVGSNEVQVAGSVPGPVELIGLGGVDIFNSFVFKFTTEDGTAYVIDQRTGLQNIADANNNIVTLSAGGIIHSNGKSIIFTRDSLGRITQVTDPNGNAQTYTYDANGDLVSYTDNENNTSTYTYDPTHRLLTIQDPRGIQPIRNDYDADGRLLSHRDGFGKVITYIHDLPGRIETVIDRLGHPTTFAYDERGNVLSKTDARGGVTTFTYDANDNVLTETNALGKTTAYTYDLSDHRTSITDPLLHVTQFTYNAVGKVLTTTDPLGHVTENTYNAAGNLLTTKDALNNITTFTYSVFDGQRTSMTDALNNTTHYHYVGSYLTKETDALGHETTFTHDSNGNRTSQTSKRTNAQGQLETITTSYEYDKLSRLKKTIFADGSITQVEYNSAGQQSATIDQLGHRTEFTYDDMGRLTRTDYPDGSHDEITYDAEGRRLQNKGRAGHLTSYVYDELGRLTKTQYSDGTFASSTYDVVGQVLSITDARGNVTHYEYDDVGRRTKVRNALNQETGFAYDADGNQLSMIDALSRITTYEYDLNNRRTRTTYADSTFDRVAYDALGRSVSKTDPAGKTTQFSYDELGRLTKVEDALNQETTFAYNEPGQQISQTDANDHTTRFEYDQLGSRVKRILPGGQFEIYSYDNGGNLASRTDFNGKTTAFNYDVMRRLLSKAPDASLNEASISFTYNILGQRATMDDASGTTVYTYDARNRLSSKQTPFGTLNYTYNEGGNLLTTRSSNANGVSVDYSYDALNRLATVEDNQLAALNGGVTSYGYDTVGNLQSYSHPNGVTSSYTYNSLNRLAAMVVTTATSSLAGYSYTLGPAGNRTAVTELSGRTENYTYDALYRLTGESIANDPQGINGSVTYGYDAVGNRLNRTSSVGPLPSQSSSYDVNDRLANDSYDNNGNTITANGNSYAFDFENHLTSLNSGNVTYVYDGDGNRVGKTVGGVTTNYLVDTNNPTGYAQVVEELHAGSVVTSFTYGHDLISQRIVGGSLSFYGYDGHGSVRLLTDATATVTDTYDYDAFGNLISRTGTTSNDYLYSGEQFDANLGFYYLRARYLNPSSGRFWTMDSFAGSGYDPISLHKYLYANADPVNRLDPNGQFSLLNTVITSTSIGAVSGFGLGFLTGGLQGAVRGAFQGAIIGALIPLTGAGVGYALLGNAARGVFIVGWGVGLGNAGVSGYSFATATTGEERFDAGISLLATAAFMFVGPKVLERINTRVISGEQANADFLAQRGGVGERPWNPPDWVTETTLFRTAKYVRVYVQGRNSPAGAWVMEASEIEGMSMSEIQQKFALPFTPSHITAVDVPAGTTIRVGTAGANAFGPGGGMQVEIQRPN